MSTVAVVGGGPAGSSAALFTAKNGLDTVLFDTDETWMHKAHLFNYLGIESIDGGAFMETAHDQVDEFGVDRHQGEAVTGVEPNGDGFSLATDADEYTAEYVVLGSVLVGVGGEREFLTVRIDTRDRFPLVAIDAEFVDLVVGRL